MSDATATKPEELAGQALDDALKEHDLPRSGTADEKRARLADHLAAQDAAGEDESDAGAEHEPEAAAEPAPEVNASELPNPAVARSKAANLEGGPVGGRVDHLTRRSDADALEGHFVKIDLNNADAAKAIEDVVGGPADDHDYGVYLEPASVDPEDGYPLTAKVRLRDETNGLVVVPYAALRQSEAGHR